MASLVKTIGSDTQMPDDLGESSSSMEMRFDPDKSFMQRLYNDAVLEAKGPISYDESDLLSQSRTIEILIDKDIEYYMRGAHPADIVREAEVMDFYEAPPAASMVRPQVPNGARVSQISLAVRTQFETFLDPPSLGTMCNWEYLAARLGLKSNQITYLKSVEKPTLKLLDRFSDRLLDDILDIICDLGRVDLLISLRKHIGEMKTLELCSEQATDSGIGSSEGASTSMERSYLSGTQISQSASLSCNTMANKKYVLVVHHEDVFKSESWFRYRLLMKNLRYYGEKNNVEFCDIDTCFDESDLFVTVDLMFTNAFLVIFVFSKDFCNLLAKAHERRNGSSSKKYAYNMSVTEYARGCRNLRFRAVVYDRERTVKLPGGWPNNTLVYSFPSMFTELCKRIFMCGSKAKEEDIGVTE